MAGKALDDKAVDKGVTGVGGVRLTNAAKLQNVCVF